MIPVLKKSEPSNFDVEVRRPGNRYLAGTTTPIFDKRNRHWKNSTKSLNEAYDRICAYSCFYLPTPGSVDHYLPKKHYPNLAYEWDNYRLALPRVNSHKGDSLEVLDPFLIQEGWFVLDFPSCLVKAGDGISSALSEKVNKTIEVLKLNDDDIFVQERCDAMLSFAENELTLSFLQKRYPFLAKEIIRHGIQTTASLIFRRRSL